MDSEENAQQAEDFGGKPVFNEPYHGEDPFKRLTEFMEKVHKTEILEALRKGIDHIVIEFSDLAKFDPELGDELLEHPDEIIKTAELAVDQFEPEQKKKRFHVRFRGLPESQCIMVRNIRSKNINKLYQLEGIIRQKSDVRPQVTNAKFECPSCGNIISILQLDKKFREPSRCGCGRKGKFRLLNKELIDAQGITC